jgi:quercetin dioxygenase-like cupin family protein
MADDPVRAFAVGPSEGRRIDLGDGFVVVVKADERDTAGAVSLLETHEPPGLGPPVHVHDDCAEAFYVLEGEYVMMLASEEVVCGPGSFVFIPRGAPHTFKTCGVASRKLNFYFPAAMVGYFDALATALAGGLVDEAELGRIAREHAMEIVGPPPERYV